jgi:Flp pilus assembly protein TadD
MSEFVVEKGEKPNDLTVLSDIDKKLATALTYKEQGTDHFKAGNFKKAIATYAKVMAFTR